MPHLKFLIGVLAAVALGSSAMACRRPFSVSRCAIALAVGLALAAPTVIVLALLGLPSRARFLLAAEALLAGGLFLFQSGRGNLPGSTERKPRSWVGPLSSFVLAASFLAAAAKWFRVPLWSWDHFAIWGMKARRIVQDGMLDLGFLRLPVFAFSHTDYPIGLPLSWRVLSLALPEEFFFKAAHVLLALALTLLVRRIALRASGSHPLANTLAAFVCVSPLFWDTEALGLADLPLAFFTIASVALLLEARDFRVPVWVAGWVIGFVSWIKKEGVPLSLLLLALGAFLLLRDEVSGAERARRIAGLVLPAVLLQLAAFAVSRLLVAPAFGFFWGDWRGRASGRLRHSGDILGPLAKELLRIEWWGLWPLFALAFFYCVATRKPIASFLFGIVFVMLGSYSAVYFGTYLDPLQHLQNSFFRIAAALVPLGAIAISFALERDPADQKPEPGAIPAIE